MNINYKDLEIDLENCYDYETFRRGFKAQFEYEANDKFSGMKDWYEILEVGKDVSKEELKLKFRKLSKKYHPDICGNDEKYKDIVSAYEVLSDDRLKAKYDRTYEEYKLYERVMASPATLERFIRKEYEENLKRMQEKQYEDDYEYDDYDDEKYVSYRIIDRFRDFITEEFYRFADANDELKEEKQPNFTKRHRRVDNIAFNRYRVDDMTMKEEVLFQLKRLAMHVGNEIYFQGKNLAHPFRDGAEKYILRNKFIPVYALILALTVNGIGTMTGSKDDTALETSVAQQTIETEIADENTYESDYVLLNRSYEIRGGDTLSQLAEDAGVSQSMLQSVNNITEPSRIMMGQKIEIPYKVKKEDLMYYEYSVEFDNTMSLQEFARNYDTDVKTIVALNSEAIIDDHGVYIVMSNSLYVPKFITQEELHDKKSSMNY